MATGFVADADPGVSWFVLPTAVNGLPDDDGQVFVMQNHDVRQCLRDFELPDFPSGNPDDVAYVTASFDGVGTFGQVNVCGCTPLPLRATTIQTPPSTTVPVISIHAWVAQTRRPATTTRRRPCPTTCVSTLMRDSTAMVRALTATTMAPVIRKKLRLHRSSRMQLRRDCHLGRRFMRRSRIGVPRL